MKKLFLITLTLLLLSSPSFGEWKEVGQNYDGVSFIEIDTVRKKGNLSYYNWMQDFFEPKSFGLSSKGRGVMNCKTKKYKEFFSKYYDESMGRGKMNSMIDDDDSWSDFMPGSIVDKYFKLVC